MRNIATDLGSIYSSLDLRLNSFESSVSKAIQGFYKLQTGTQKASSIMDKSVCTSVSNIEKSYKLWEQANNRTGKSLFDNSKKIQSYKDRIRLLAEEIKKSEKTLSGIEKQCGKNSKEVEQYKSHVLDLKTSHSQLTQEMKQAERETTTFAGRLKILGNQFEKIDKKYEAFDKVGNKFSSIGSKLTMGVTLPLVGAGTAAGKFAMDFDKGAAKVSTIADTTKVSMNTLKKGVVDLSNDTGTSTTELNEALYQTISAGVDTANSVEFLGDATKTAKAGFTDSSTAIDVLTTTINAYGLKAKDATKISDQLMVAQNAGKTTIGEMGQSLGNVIPIAASVNMSTKELFTSVATLTKNGIKTAQSITGVKAALSNIIKPSDEAQKLSKKLGLEFNAAHLKSVGWSKFLSEIKEKTHGNTEQMAKLFGSVEGLNAVTVLAGKGSKDFADILGQMGNSAGKTDEAFDKMSETTEEKFKRGLNKLKNSAMEVGVKLLPIAEKGINFLSKLADGFSKLSPTTQDWIVKVGMASAALGPLMSGIGGTIKGVGTLLKTGKKVGVFFGLFEEATTVATAVEGVGTAAGVAGGSSGLGLFAGGLGAVSSIALPVAAGVAAVGGAIYIAHKNTQYLNDSCIKSAEDMGTMETAMAGLNEHVIHTNEELDKMNIKHKEWSKKVSPQTQKALDGIANKIANYNMELSGAAKLDKLADKDTSRKLNSQLDSICNSAINKIKSKQPQIQKTLSDSFKLDGKVDKNEKKILDSLDKSGNDQIKKIQNIKKKILDLEKKASKQTGAVRQKTLKEVEKLTQQIGNMELKSTAKSKKELLAAQADFNARMKNLDMNGLSKLLSSKAKLRVGENKKITQNYDKQIELLKLNMGNVDKETAKAYKEQIKKLETNKEESIKKENEKYQGYLNAAIEKYPQLINYLDMQHGTMLTKEEQQKQLELNTYASKMSGMLDVTKTGYYQIKDSVTGQMHNCYVEVDKATGQIVGAWDSSTGQIYGNPVKARENIDKDLKNGVKFQPIVTSYNSKKQDIWDNAVEVQTKENHGLFDWVKTAYSGAQTWLGKHPLVTSIVKKTLGIDGNAKGTDYFKGGLTWVDEEGNELIELPGKGPKLMDLPRGTKIHNHQKSNSIKQRILEKQSKKPKGYATGTDFAESGIHEVAEDGIEIVASRQYRLFNGGEKVFNNKDSKKLLSDLFKTKKQSESIAKEAIAQAKEKVSIKPKINTSESSMKVKNAHMLNWGDKRKDTYLNYVNFVKKLNEDEVKKSKELLDKDYKNRIESINNQIRIARFSSKKKAEQLEKSKEALGNYYNVGNELLDRRSEKLKDSINSNKLLFDNSVKSFDEAINVLSVDTNDFNKNLANQKAIVIIQKEKIEALKNRYEQLSKTLGTAAEETLSMRDAFYQAKNELQEYTAAVNDAYKSIGDEINSLSDRVKSALKERYDDELKAQEDSIDKELSNLDKWKDESIKRIENVYDAKIEAIDNQIEKEDKADKKEEENRKINSLKSAMEFEHNEFNKVQMQKELNNILKEREKRLHKEQLEKQKEKLEKQKENEVASINNVYESSKKNLERQLESYRDFYNKRTKEAAIQAEAEKMIMNENQADIIELLHSYEKDYEQAGQSLGEKLVQGFKPKIQEIKYMIDSIQASFEEARDSSLKAMAAESSVVYSIPRYKSGNVNNDNRKSVVNNNSLTFNSPKVLSPSETRRQTETMLRNLNFSMT